MAGEYNKAIQEARAAATQEIHQAIGKASEQAQDMIGEARDEGQQIFTEKKSAVAAGAECNSKST